MKNYNDVLTVQELIDLVAFLQSEYKIKSPIGIRIPIMKASRGIALAVLPPKP